MDNCTNNQVNIYCNFRLGFLNTVQKYFFGLFIVLSLFSCEQAEITIGIVGDQFGSYNADQSYLIMQKSVNKMANYHPDILLHVGDMVESVRDINTFKEYESNFIIAAKIMNSINKPWILAVGDHDVVPPDYQVCSTDRSREKWFTECWQQYKPKGNTKLYYSRDVKEYHFISLYSLENLHTDPRWGSIFLNKINTEQLSWLKSDLEQNKHSNGIIVLIHHPQWYVWSNWMEIHNLLRDYPVIAVIA